MQYEVTIGIPVYKAADYIQNTMESALAQTFDNIEYLVLDDCGNDGSISVVEKIKSDYPRGKDIRILYHDRNYGVGVSRNRILKEARGRYLYFLDSDDLMEPDTISRMMSVMKQYLAQVVYGSWERVDNVSHTPSEKYIYPFTELLLPDALAMYAFRNYSSFRISVCNCLMDVDFLRSSRLQFLDTVFWEDLAFTYEMVTKVSRAVLLPDITYHYLCRPGSLSHYQDREKLEKAEILKNVSIIDYLKEKCSDLVEKSYLPYLCYNLEMNGFYIVCHILKYYQRIVPSFSNREMQSIIRHPLSFSKILRFRKKLFPNILLWLLGNGPTLLLLPTIKVIARLKKVI